MTNNTNPTESKNAAFEAHEAENTTITAEEVWEQQEQAENNLESTTAKELDQYKHPEDYQSEPVQKEIVQAERISELLDQ